MVAIRNLGKEHGQWGLAVKDVFLISIAAHRNPGKEHRKWGLAVKDLFLISGGGAKVVKYNKFTLPQQRKFREKGTSLIFHVFNIGFCL